MAAGTSESTTRAMSVEVDGRRVPLTAEGLERAQRSTDQLGKKLVEAVRRAVDLAGDGGKSLPRHERRANDLARRRWEA
jgi:hypothetical protein